MLKTVAKNDDYYMDAWVGKKLPRIAERESIHSNSSSLKYGDVSLC